MENLKPCPFCGSKDLDGTYRTSSHTEINLQSTKTTANESRTFGIGCNGCGFILNGYTFNYSEKGRNFNAATVEEVVAMWNTRRGRAYGGNAKTE